MISADSNLYLAAFIVGLLGSGHCVGMCGPLTVIAAGNARLRAIDALAVNVGRLLSYALAGTAIAATALTLADLSGLKALLLYFKLVAGVMIILAGCYVAGIWLALRHVERLGTPLWHRLSQLFRQLVPVRTPLQAVAYGMVWGWLPCGLVYSTLTWTLAADSPLQGALIMLSFGAGTLPSMLTLTLISHSSLTWLKSRQFKRVAGITLIALGAWLAHSAITQL